MSNIIKLALASTLIVAGVYGQEWLGEFAHWLPGLSFNGFWWPSITMGIGIAIDVALATVAKYRDNDMTALNWTLPIACTHIGFPAFGYYGFWGLGLRFPTLNILFGFAGFTLVALFLYEVMCEWVGAKPKIAISKWIGGVFGFSEADSRRIVTILAVSWDALWSGPAKAAQAAAGHWTTDEVQFSFVVAGLVVALVAWIFLKVAERMRHKKFDDPEQLNKMNLRGKFALVSVIGGFGVLSLWQGVLGDANLLASIAVAAALTAVFFLFWKKELHTFGLEEAKENVKG
jgi:hypothetical protein